MKPLRLLLADEHTVVRSGIRMLLQSFAGIEIVAEADGGQAALDLTENGPISRCSTSPCSTSAVSKSRRRCGCAFRKSAW